MPSLFDLHIHTTRGSSDSSLSPYELVETARSLGLTGVCLTEHGGGWTEADALRLSRESGLVVVPALEVDTDMGHILVFGLDGYRPGVSSLRELRRIVDRVGGFLICAHPFRNLFNPPPYNRNLLFPDPASRPGTPAEACRHPVFELVDEVEVVNGANSDLENRFALETARRLGFRGTGGSDAHSVHGVGRGLIVIEGEVRTPDDFLSALRAGAYRPAYRDPTGAVHIFGEEVGEPEVADQGPPLMEA